MPRFELKREKPKFREKSRFRSELESKDLLGNGGPMREKASKIKEISGLVRAW